jgi:hypothetical protein
MVSDHIGGDRRSRPAVIPWREHGEQEMRKYSLSLIFILCASLALGAPKGRFSDLIVDNTVSIPEASISGTRIIDNTMAPGKILDNSIMSSKILDNSITSEKILDNTITSSKILDGTIPASKLSYTPGGYALGFGAAYFNPADNITYYFGDMRALAPTTTPALYRIYIPKSGTLKAANIIGWHSAIAGTNEAWDMYILIDNTTSVLIQSIASTSVPRVWSNMAINTAVTAGSYFEIKAVSPTWSTNPVEYFLSGSIYIE